MITLRNPALATALIAALFAGEAEAKTKLNAELGIATQAGEATTELAVRAGPSLDLLFLHVRPEIGARTLLDTGEIAGFVGGRFGVGTGVVPSFFAHGGSGTNGGYWDAGFGVDVTFIPKLEFGAQLATLGFGTDTYLSMTLHGGLSF
jgi:hypothetical protein